MQRPRHRRGVPGWRMDLELADTYWTNQQFAIKLLLALLSKKQQL
jgi:hypothetical protein